MVVNACFLRNNDMKLVNPYKQDDTKSCYGNLLRQEDNTSLSYKVGALWRLLQRYNE